MDNIIILSGLHPFEYEHTFDAKALDTLQQVPGLDIIIRKLNKHTIERFIIIQYTGSGIRITKDNFQKLYNLLLHSCEIINLPKIPDFYISPDHNVNGFTVGIDNPIIVLTSGSIDYLDDHELLYLIGHEIGHIKSRHTLYHQMAEYFPLVGEIIGRKTLGIGELISSPLVYALRHWSRMSEFTADRAGLLACQDLNIAARVMMKLSGMPVRYFNDMKLEAFIEQARQFDKLDYDRLNELTKFLMILGSTHPWTVLRAAELLEWVESGEYQKVLDRTTSERKHVKNDSGVRSCRRCNYLLKGTEKFCPLCGLSIRNNNNKAQNKAPI